MLWFALLATLWSTAGCRQQSAPTEQPCVVASFFPLYDFARTLGGTNFEVVCLVPPGGDPHAMEASPGAARTVGRADLVLLLGLGMDGWLEKLAAGRGSNRTAMLSQGLPTRRLSKGQLAEFAEADHGHAHDVDPNEADPHVWLDPLLAQQIVRQIAGELARIAPSSRDAVFARRDAYVAELQRLHEEYTAALADVPRRQVVTFHGAFGYLFARYGLETVGVIEMFPGDEPSAAYLRKLVDLMRQLNMKVIFAEPQLPDQPARVIAREVGGRVERLDPCETILPDEPNATYLERQRRNLATLRAVLSASP